MYIITVFLQHIVTDLLNRKIMMLLSCNFPVLCNFPCQRHGILFMHFANLEVYKLVYKNEFDIPMDLPKYKI